MSRPGGLAETRSSGGQVLGRYRIVRRLAQGGMGVVYLGRLEGAAGFAKPVVIKRVIPDIENLEETTARFVREAQILSNLQHPGIVGVLDFGEEVGGHCMVLEYIHGYDLSKWLKFLQLRSTPMSWEHSVFIMLRVLEALSYAHGFRRSDGLHTEVLHRDVSPGNILLDIEGRVRLADFGIACMDEGEPGQFKTQTGVLKGKVAFLAPELFAGTAPSASSDVYACAVVLYQMLAGRNPFSADNESRVMWRLITEPPTPLSEYRDDLPPELQEAVLRALEKEPEARFESADALAEELRGTLTRSEAEIGRELRDRLRADFTGELPEVLRMEPLATRDMAWRTGTGMASNAPSAPPGSFRAAAASMPPRTELQDWRANSNSPAQPIAVRPASPENETGPSSHSSQTMTSLGTSLPLVPSTERSSDAEPSRPGPPPRRRAPLPPPASAARGAQHPVPSVEFDVTEGAPTATVSVGIPSIEPTPFTSSASALSLAGHNTELLGQPSSTGTAAVKSLPSSSRRPAAGLQVKHVVGIALSVGFTVAATLGGFQLLLQPRAVTSSPGRYILVEGADSPGAPAPRQAAAAPAPVTSPEPAVAEPAAIPAVQRPKAKSAVMRTPRARIRSESDASVVSRQFGQKHRLLQSCFEKHASDIEGHPQVSVKFDVASTGKVRSVHLAPAALEATKLGQCLLKVARGTRFSSLKKSIRFTIPIQARAVRR